MSRYYLDLRLWKRALLSFLTCQRIYSSIYGWFGHSCLSETFQKYSHIYKSSHGILNLSNEQLIFIIFLETVKIGWRKSTKNFLFFLISLENLGFSICLSSGLFTTRIPIARKDFQFATTQKRDFFQLKRQITELRCFKMHKMDLLWHLTKKWCCFQPNWESTQIPKHWVYSTLLQIKLGIWKKCRRIWSSFDW